jgi:hypothetical protein
MHAPKRARASVRFVGAPTGAPVLPPSSKMVGEYCQTLSIPKSTSMPNTVALSQR